MHFEIICRVCLQEGTMTPIFDTQKSFGGSNFSCVEMLIACATVSAKAGDGFPGQICATCYKGLCSAFEFRQLCESSFAFLLEYAAKNVDLENIKLESCDMYITNPDDTKHNLDIKEEEDLMKDEVDEDLHYDLGEAPSPFEDNVQSSEKNISDKLPRKLEHRKRKKKKTHKKVTKEKMCKIGEEKGRAKMELLTCPLCPKTFKWNYRLAAHQDSHIGIKRYFCEICKKSYRNEKDHKNMHRRGFNYKCEICSKCFNTKAKLTIHIETHSANRERIICTEEGCGKAFVTMGGLDRHRVSHLGIKNFICHLCSKSFIDKYQLEIHLGIHNNERKYSCSYCGKAFITSSAKTSHEKWHTKTRNYRCHHCEKGFVNSSSLKRHLLIHSKELHLSCRFCAKSFSRQDNRKRHEMAMHLVTEEKTT